MPARFGRNGVLVAIGSLALALGVAGCGGGTTKTAAATSSAGAVASSVPAANPTGSAAPTSADPAAAFAKYEACLQAHGEPVPTFSPGARRSGSAFPRPSGSFSRPPGGFAGRSGGPGGGFGGPDASANPSFSAAQSACASLRPQGTFGAGRAGAGGAGSVSAPTFAAFKSCMADKGVTIAATDAQQAIRALDRSDAKVAAALTVCQPILGQPARSPLPSSSASASS